jgi:hypothetical protein
VIGISIAFVVIILKNKFKKTINYSFSVTNISRERFRETYAKL